MQELFKIIIKREKKTENKSSTTEIKWLDFWESSNLYTKRLSNLCNH